MLAHHTLQLDLQVSVRHPLTIGLRDLAVDLDVSRCALAELLEL